MTSISVQDLSFTFGTHKLFEKVSFSLEENDRLGIIGSNGCGKSTLFSLLTGDRTPDTGSIYISKGKTVGILTQTQAFENEKNEEGTTLTPLEKMFQAFPHLLRYETELQSMEARLKTDHSLSLASEYAVLQEKYRTEGGLEFRSRSESLLKKLGFSQEEIRQPISCLSGGQKTRLALAVELSREPDILLLDEPTNHLDLPTLTFLEDYLAGYKKCVLIISHDRYFLDHVVNKTLAFEFGYAKLYNGNYSQSREQRRLDREIQEKNYKDQQKEIAHQETYIARLRQWNREKSIIAAESRQKMLDKMVRIEKPKTERKNISLSFNEALPSGNDVLSLHSLSMRFEDKVLFENLSLSLKRKDRLFIIGPNGCGKSTLIRILMGKQAPAKGSFSYGFNVHTGYYDQENQNLDETKTVLDELWDAYPQTEETKIRNTLASFHFFGEDVFKSISVLSGGERARLTLAKLMLSHVNLLILDEPTNNLDIPSRESLENALSSFDGTILAVSHDRYFIDRLATRILGFTGLPGRESQPVDYKEVSQGKAYSEFRDWVLSLSETSPANLDTASEKTPCSDAKTSFLQNKKDLSEARKRSTRLTRLKEEEARMEDELSRISKELYEESATDYLRAAELYEKKETLEEQLLAVYEEIEKLERL